ncbi:uncharacterized protein O3C94_013100 isoform 2-T2 [Discoglossus pictus]
MFREKAREIIYIIIYLTMRPEQVSYCCVIPSSDNKPHAPEPSLHISVELKNFRSILKWETKEQNCDIKLCKSDNSTPHYLSSECRGGHCIADLTLHLQDIHLTYWVMVGCPRGGHPSLRGISNLIQLYKDVKVGPPIIDLSLWEERLNVSVSLPLTPVATQDAASRSPLNHIRNLRHILVTVTVDNATVYTSFHYMTSDPQSLSLPILALPGSRFCVNVTFPKTKTGIGGLKCETVPPKQREGSSLTGLSVFVILLFTCVILILLGLRYMCSHQTNLPGALSLQKFSADASPVQLMIKEVTEPDRVSLVVLEWDQGASSVPTNGYEHNGLQESCKLDPDVEKEDKYSTGGSSVYSCGIPYPCKGDTLLLYKEMPPDWNTPPDIDLNSIKLLGREQAEERNLMGLFVEVRTDLSEQGNSSDSGSIYYREEEEEQVEGKNIQQFSGYEKRSTFH